MAAPGSEESAPASAAAYAVMAHGVSLLPHGVAPYTKRLADAGVAAPVRAAGQVEFLGRQGLPAG